MQHELSPVAWHEPTSVMPRHLTTPAVLEWMAHVDAGRIGVRLPTPPSVAANHDRNAALFAALRRGRVAR